MISKRGYTLLEVMVALLVFSVLALITSAATNHAFTTDAHVKAQSERLMALDSTLIQLRQDIEQAVARGVLGNEMHTFPVLLGQSYYLELTRGGIVNPGAQELRSTLKRIAWLCDNGKLVRRSWEKLDAPNRNQYRDKLFLNNLTHCSFAFLKHNRQISKQWPEGSNAQNQKKEELPIAIQFALTLQDWGNLNLLLVIPGALYG